MNNQTKAILKFIVILIVALKVVNLIADSYSI